MSAAAIAVAGVGREVFLQNLAKERVNARLQPDLQQVFNFGSGHLYERSVAQSILTGKKFISHALKESKDEWHRNCFLTVSRK